MEEKALRDIVDESDINHFDSEGVLRRINSTIKLVRKLKAAKWVLGIAASLFIVLSTGYLFWQNELQTAKKQPLLSLVTMVGQQKKISLADGTGITLNCSTSLRYSAKFAGEKQEVDLDGEAFLK